MGAPTRLSLSYVKTLCYPINNYLSLDGARLEYDVIAVPGVSSTYQVVRKGMTHRVDGMVHLCTGTLKECSIYLAGILECFRALNAAGLR